MPRKRIRLDVLLTERNLFPSRTVAARAVRAGQVKLGRDGPVALRPSQEVMADQEVELAEARRFVSRGGIKLENALKALEVPVKARRCLDVGASTGGFTDCLLEHGAAHVIALDVAYGQIEDSLRRHPQVTVIERLNARDLKPGDLEYEPDLTVIDVSFISLTKVLGPVRGMIHPDGEILAMVKPQFELGRARVGRGGVVRSETDRREAVSEVADFARGLGFGLNGIAPTGLPGPKGNLETFIRLGHPGPGAPDGAALCEGVAI
ncbi:MAG: TlyA family RNA methyltransferase [Solirubrobacterales bacterium]|nr:TlyA family RNA methyltransferase [Solirubrobacterales bacterium]